MFPIRFCANTCDALMPFNSMSPSDETWARTKPPRMLVTVIWPRFVSRSTDEFTGTCSLKFTSPMSLRPRLSAITSTIKPSPVWRGDTFAAGDSIVAESLTSSRFQDSTVIVPEMFFSSTRTLFLTGYRFDKCCWPNALVILSATKTKKNANNAGFRDREVREVSARVGNIPVIFMWGSTVTKFLLNSKRGSMPAWRRVKLELSKLFQQRKFLVKRSIQHLL